MKVPELALDLTSLLVPGHGPEHVTGMDAQFRASLENLFASAPPEIQAQMQLLSGYRSPERQGQLWQEALAKYGSPEAARKWVAPPGKSQHNHGRAADLRYADDSAREWAHANAAQFGLSFPLSNEPWHIELATARGGGTAPAAAPIVPDAGGAPLMASTPLPAPAPIPPNMPPPVKPGGSPILDVLHSMAPRPSAPEPVAEQRAPEPETPMPAMQMPQFAIPDPTMVSTTPAAMPSLQAPMLMAQAERMVGSRGKVRAPALRSRDGTVVR